MTQRDSWILVFVAAILAVCGGYWLARELDSSGPQLATGTWLPRPREIGDFRLIDGHEQPFTLQQLEGHPTLVFFGFTHCPDVCPTTLAALAQLKKRASVAALQVVVVSVDPARDTAPVLARYVHAFDPTFIGLTGDPGSIQALTRRFGIAVSRVDLPGGDYTMDHSAAVFLLDTHARIVAVFTPPFDVPRFAQDLRAAAPHLAASS